MPGVKDLAAIAAAGDFSVALTAGGEVFEWGGGVKVPTQVSLTDVKAIAAGDLHRLALKKDGSVWAWGQNDAGQIGDGSTTARPSPVKVANLQNILGIAAVSKQSFAIASDFSIRAWGANADGQLGDGTTTNRLSPVSLPTTKVIAIASSNHHTIALTTNVQVFGWGRNVECELDVDPRASIFDPIACSSRSVPTRIFTNVNPKGVGLTIATSNRYSLVVDTTGLTHGSGGQTDTNQQAGLCSTDTVLGAAGLYGPPQIAEVASGPAHSLLLAQNGEVWHLGANLAGQAGNGNTTTQHCPEAVPGLVGATAVAAGNEHALALVEGVLQGNVNALAFGAQAVGTASAVRTVTVTNQGWIPVTVSGVTATTQFTATDNCPDAPATLARNASCTLSVQYSPTVAGAQQGSASLRHDGRTGDLRVDLTGQGIEPKVVFQPVEHDFGNQAVNTASAPRLVTIRNDGPATLLIQAITVTAGFGLSNNLCPPAPAGILAGGQCTVQVDFRPTQAGAAVGELRVDYAPGKRAVMSLKGDGT